MRLVGVKERGGGWMSRGSTLKSDLSPLFLRKGRL